jgi:gamma-glutamylcyclotransferase (GGCT)/AIG2-like uncharacterized protein YtfP
MATSSVFLFSYGSLQKKSVQRATFGREPSARADSLPGYTRTLIKITDPDVVVSTGETHYANVVPSSDPADAVAGIVLDITERELGVADKYEERANYRRISVMLKSGIQAWVYVSA